MSGKTTVTDRATAERVAAGAEFLDEHDPQWWRPGVDRAINLDTLALDETDKCILGQRCPLEVLTAYLGPGSCQVQDGDFGGAYYAYARHLSGLTGRKFAGWASARGCITPDDDTEGWLGLTAEWQRVIAGRRSAA